MRLVLFILVHIGIFCFSQENKCQRIIDSLNKPLFEQKPVLSKKFKKIKINKEDTLYGYYEGIVRQLSRENYLVERSSSSSKFMVQFQQCLSYKFLDWQTSELYTKRGDIIKRTSVFYNRLNSGETYIFNNQKKAVRSQGLGDPLFKMKIEDFIKILEKNNITPQSTKMRTGSGGKIFMYKHITPSGRFWEYQLIFRDNLKPSALILISDATGEVLVKGYDIAPRCRNEEKEDSYLDIRDSIIYPKNDGFMLTKDGIIEILKKKNYNIPYDEIKKYANRTWLIQSDYQRDFKTLPKLFLLDDITGEILINIDDL